MTTYVRRHGPDLLDQHGAPLRLQGVGIGGWLLIEGYMIQSFGSLDRPRRLKDHITRLAGEDTARWFFDTWVQRFFTKEDVGLIARQGFNCIRIPIDYAWLFEPSDEKVELEAIDSSFARLDEVLDWCEQFGIYAILDLHGAPGGQTGTNIDNSSDDHPSLFTSPVYRAQTIYVWQTIAKRYRDRDTIAAYDLLNEPLPKWFEQYNDQLIPLYQDLIHAIRTVDPHHLITLEGWHWSTDLSCFSTLLDDNLLLQFHKYWSPPDRESLTPYLELRDALQAPLLMGEGGENNPLWYAAVFPLYDELDISWCFWTYKKMTATNGIVMFERPKRWEAFLNGTLSEDDTRIVLTELLDAIRFKRCTVQHAVVDHLFRRNTYQLYAFAYDQGGPGVSHAVNKDHTTSMRSSDGVRIANLDNHIIEPDFKQYGGEDVPVSSQLYVWLDPLEWIRFTLANPTGRLSIRLDQVDPKDVSLTVEDGAVYRRSSDWIVSSDAPRVRLFIRALRPVCLGTIQVEERPGSAMVTNGKATR